MFMTRCSALALVSGIVLAAGTRSALAETRMIETIEVVDSALTDSTTLTGKVVYVDFWASWCLPCRKSYPWMSELSAKYRDRGLEVVTINVDKEWKTAEKFLADMKTSLPVVHDPKGELAKLYELKVMPSSFIYGRNGKLRGRHEGFQPSDGPVLDSLIDALLKEASTQ
jgi:thiol-disulfide isomerase/thioredoxin